MLERYYKELEKVTLTIQHACLKVLQLSGEITYSQVEQMRLLLSDYKGVLEIQYGMKQDEAIMLLLNQILQKFQEEQETINEKKYELIGEISEMIITLNQCVDVSDDRIGLVLIVKDDAHNIMEWIEYHREVGVSKFYIYDNESSDNLKEILEDYIKEGIVVYHYWPGSVVQLSAYNDAIEHYKYCVDYMGFIDADEFIVPIEDVKLPELIESIVSGFNGSYWSMGLSCGGIGVNWRCYGTSFHEKRQDGLVIENYNYRTTDDNTVNYHIKTICNPRKATAFLSNSHECKYENRYICISENGSAIIGPFFSDTMCKKIRINHYYTKSQEELEAKMRRGWPDQDGLPSEKRIEETRERVKSYNEVYDDIMARYVPRVKERLKKRQQNSD